ncbi:uncharacterized protein LOC132617405 [Lycium barbarum]|uniref:uncharacterized protein LOC132617405 n=1 Tax=Lycium barbarum TaxID=112863 RepID=UPI00293F5018|nr:uncharacterized protein LOC132617405 [Lycium barbarum]
MGTPENPELARLNEPATVNTIPPTTTDQFPSNYNYAKAIQNPKAPILKQNRLGNPEITAKYTTPNGVPAVLFNNGEYYGVMSDECKFTLVGKFIRSMPQIEKLRARFAEIITVRGKVTISVYDYRTVFLDFSNEDDFKTVWYRRSIEIDEQVMWLEKWTPEFKPHKDSPVVLVWVLLPGLPFHLHSWNYIKQIVAPIGTPLMMDPATENRTRPSMAKVRVEVNLTETKINSISIGTENENCPRKGFYQKLEYENAAKFCENDPNTSTLARTEQGEDGFTEVNRRKNKKVLKNTNTRNGNDHARGTGKNTAQNKTEKNQGKQKTTQINQQAISQVEGQGIKCINTSGKQTNRPSDQTAVAATGNSKQPVAATGNSKLPVDQIVTANSKHGNEINPAEMQKPEEENKQHENKGKPRSGNAQEPFEESDKPLDGKKRIEEQHQNNMEVNQGLEVNEIADSQGSSSRGIQKDHMSPTTVDTACLQLKGGRIKIDLGNIEFIPPENRQGTVLGNNSDQEYCYITSEEQIAEISLDEEVPDSFLDVSEEEEAQILNSLFEVFAPTLKECKGPITQERDQAILQQGLSPRDAGFVGNIHTWCNGRGGTERIHMRLDRLLHNEEWSTRFPNINVEHLSKTGSDHSLLLVNCTNDNQQETEVYGNPMWILQQKLKTLARELSKWSRNSIGDVFENVKKFEKEVSDAEPAYLNSDADTDRMRQNKTKVEYIKWLKMEDSILRQKARIKWAEKGDSNTKYFHSTIKARRKRAQIYKIKDRNDQWVEGNANISKAAIDHFSEIFTRNSRDINMDFIRGCDNLDNWTQQGSLYQMLNPTVKPDTLKLIKSIHISKEDEKDQAIWNTNSNGLFTCSSAFDLLRNKRVAPPIYNYIWIKEIPFKVSFFMWKLLKKNLPLDANLSRFNIDKGASCCCCRTACVETDQGGNQKEIQIRRLHLELEQSLFTSRKFQSNDNK